MGVVMGLHFETASSGDKAIEMYQAALNEGKPYTLIILDLAMPDKSGFEVAEEIRGRGDSEVPIVFCTAYADSMTPARALMLGAAGVWKKPIAYIELKENLANLLHMAL
jgi:CheY-like chemotaxis protein